MKTLNNPILTALAALLLVALALYSQPHGYTHQEVAQMDILIANTVSPMTNAEKIVYLYGSN